MAMSNLGDGPLVKAIAMARAPLYCDHEITVLRQAAKNGKLPRSFVQSYTGDPHILREGWGHRQKYPEKKLGEGIPWGAVGLNTYLEERIGEGLNSS